MSHATEEHDLVVHLANYLEKNDLEAWYAPRNIMGGIDYDKEIIAAIKDCRAFVLILSRNSDASEDVKTEVYHAVKFKKVVICLDVDDVEPENLSYLLGMRHRLNWLERRDETLDKLVHDIKMIPEPDSCESTKTIIEFSDPKPEAERRSKIGSFRKILWVLAIVVIITSCVIFPKIYMRADKPVSEELEGKLNSFLEIYAVDNVWLTVSFGNSQPVFRNTLKKGESMRWDLNSTAKVLIARPAAAKIILNGKDLGIANPSAKRSETYLYNPDGTYSTIQ
ncbi:MAG: DUF4115 domain-containing protein [Synergistaceae bacterium]|nr:DUF4115 domain-containing protein [Synergistaceae bacterium]